MAIHLSSEAKPEDLDFEELARHHAAQQAHDIANMPKEQVTAFIPQGDVSKQAGDDLLATRLDTILPPTVVNREEENQNEPIQPTK